MIEKIRQKIRQSQFEFSQHAVNQSKYAVCYAVKTGKLVYAQR